MYRKMLYLSLLIFVAFAISCSSSDEETPGPSICDEPVSLSADIVPIINTNCALPTCHIAGGQSPNFQLSESIRSNSALIGVRVSNKTMPPQRANITLSAETIEMINCWISQGALDN